MARQSCRFSAAVLAGGLSTRMGRDKAALPFGGTTLPIDMDETVFLNGNTPEDYAQLLRLLERSGTV